MVIYRRSARSEIVLHGRPRVTVYLCVLWLSFVTLAVVVYYVRDSSYVRTLSIAIMVVCMLTIFLVRRAANKVRWRVSLEQPTLRIERVGVPNAELALLDVTSGCTYHRRDFR